MQDKPRPTPTLAALHLSAAHQLGVLQEAPEITGALIVFIGDLFIPDAAHDSHVFTRPG